MQKKSIVCQNIDVFSFSLAKTIKLLQTFSKFAGGEGDEKVDVVIRGRAATAKLAALFTAVGDDKAFFGIGLALDGLKPTLTLAGAVAGVFIDMYRPKTVRAVVAGGIYQRRHLFFAVLADKTAVIFCKSLGFHKKSSQKFTNSLYFLVLVRV